MQKITKGTEPPELQNWKAAKPSGTYSNLTCLERVAIRMGCTKEQRFLCAYCCKTISGIKKDTLNEHVEPQSVAPTKTLEHTNIVASCRTARQCDSAHGNQHLPLTPLMPECETELVFKISGLVEGVTDRAKEAIRVLNLGDTHTSNRSLIERRKDASRKLLLAYGEYIEHGIGDAELIETIIHDLEDPAKEKLDSYAPVLLNILRQWLPL